ncbi:phosphatase PAP2 family protein [Paenibacillus mendelii]|uniref:Phosphatase PAP2 family protein n=1 Tax=Paenibacillus mendelii TaxID=206163 RepID=A0ABV6JK89_9BACL|nr:phosphatase PAP2 family protein [Paenibacillus mendelii]MCQ6559037.1 phosphatase PAP2 family protein [Paenibacillus mendelii]
MERMVTWLRTFEHAMLQWANRRPAHTRVNIWLGRWLGTVTHMGGATFTLMTALLCALLAPEPWGTAGLQGLAAVVISHIPVAAVKRLFRRLRPYQALPNVNTCRKPLRDSSFPSGHTTAIFAWLTPWLLIDTAWLPLLLPIAVILGLSVAWSRMFLGLHYPSDVIVGAMLGSLVATIVSLSWPFA